MSTQNMVFCFKGYPEKAWGYPGIKNIHWSCLVPNKDFLLLTAMSIQASLVNAPQEKLQYVIFSDVLLAYNVLFHLETS